MSEPPSTLHLQMRPYQSSSRKVGVYTFNKVFRVLERYLESDEARSMESACEELYQMISQDPPGGKQCSTSQDTMSQDTVAEDVDIQNEISQNEADKDSSSKSDRILSETILCISEDIPYDHQAQIKLLNLVRELWTWDILNEPLRKCVRVSGNSVRGPRAYQDYNYVQYVSMPVFRQESRGHAGGCYIPNEAAATRVLNATAFQARLASAGCLNTIDQMIWDMMGLESEQSRRQSTSIQIVSVWVIYAGYFLYNKMVIDPLPVNEDNQRMFQAVRLYRGPIFGLERWNFWQEQLFRLSQDPSITAEARYLGLRAADLMAALARNIR